MNRCSDFIILWMLFTEHNTTLSASLLKQCSDIKGNNVIQDSDFTMNICRTHILHILLILVSPIVLILDISKRQTFWILVLLFSVYELLTEASRGFLADRGRLWGLTDLHITTVVSTWGISATASRYPVHILGPNTNRPTEFCWVKETENTSPNFPSFLQWRRRISVADPGFPREDANLLFAQFFLQKLDKNEENFAQKGGGAFSFPVDPPMEVFLWDLVNVTNWRKGVLWFLTNNSRFQFKENPTDFFRLFAGPLLKTPIVRILSLSGVYFIWAVVQSTSMFMNEFWSMMIYSGITGAFQGTVSIRIDFLWTGWTHVKSKSMLALYFIIEITKGFAGYCWRWWYPTSHLTTRLRWRLDFC